MRVSRVSFILLQSELNSSSIFSFHFSIGQHLGLDQLHLIGCSVRKSSCRLRKYVSILCIPCISCEKFFADANYQSTATHTAFVTDSNMTDSNMTDSNVTDSNMTDSNMTDSK